MRAGRASLDLCSSKDKGLSVTFENGSLDYFRPGIEIIRFENLGLRLKMVHWTLSGPESKFYGCGCRAYGGFRLNMIECIIYRVNRKFKA